MQKKNYFLFEKSVKKILFENFRENLFFSFMYREKKISSIAKKKGINQFGRKQFSYCRLSLPS